MNAIPRAAPDAECRRTDEGFRIEPMDGPLGARVHGLDATLPETPGQAHALNAALRERQVLLCYGQPLGDAELLRLARNVEEVLGPCGTPASLLYAEAVPRAGGDAVWIQLAEACDLLDAGRKRQVGALQLVTYNPFLHRLRPLPAQR
jgi:taurine dioxygenase